MTEANKTSLPSWLTAQNAVIVAIGATSAVAIGGAITSLVMRLLHYTKVPAWCRSTYLVAGLTGIGAVGSVLSIILIAKKHLDAKTPLPTNTPPPDSKGKGGEIDLTSSETSSSDEITSNPKDRHVGVLGEIELSWIEPECDMLKNELTIKTIELELCRNNLQALQILPSANNPLSNEHQQITLLLNRIPEIEGVIQGTIELINKLETRIALVKGGNGASGTSLFAHDKFIRDLLIVSDYKNPSQQVRDRVKESCVALSDALKEHYLRFTETIDKTREHYAQRITLLRPDAGSFEEDNPEHQLLANLIKTFETIIETIDEMKANAKRQRDGTLSRLYDLFGKSGFPAPDLQIIDLSKSTGITIEEIDD